MCIVWPVAEVLQQQTKMRKMGYSNVIELTRRNQCLACCQYSLWKATAMKNK